MTFLSNQSFGLKGQLGPVGSVAALRSARLHSANMCRYLVWTLNDVSRIQHVWLPGATPLDNDSSFTNLDCPSHSHVVIKLEQSKAD